LQVKVLVDGNPIPSDVKIGEGGEAFFVSETDDDGNSGVKAKLSGL
jgi:phosphatidate phosphatase LPIN